MTNRIIYKFTLLIMVALFLENCGAVKPKVPASASTRNEANKISAVKNDSKKSNETQYLLKIETPVETDGVTYLQTVKAKSGETSANKKNSFIQHSKNEKVNIKANKNNAIVNSSLGNSYSNFIRVKTVYELAMDANPPLFLPHDEFETADEYKKRVSDQVSLMKEIVQMTSQKMEIKKAQRLQVAKDKELRTKSILEDLMSESSSSVEFTPTDIGRYNPEKETFPIILHSTQYQISVPREEARTFKANFQSVKIKGIKQLKPKYDVSVTVSKAHIRSRPNGSIVGIASRGDLFEHVQDEDEWFKINYKGQFGFTHMNNAELKLVDIDDAYEYHDMVAIHPTTGSLFAMTSVDKLVKAPLNLASRKLFEAGQADG
ncbi:MAG: hypothetical protein VW522_11775, partial [Candidatus Neomarinimicrobiota bacterium]